MPKKKMGRPIIGKPKDIRVQIRVDEDTIKKMDSICQNKKISRSELIRQLIKNF
jgi:metal-responsive CopG/Arc/MetJ family transcriptional regulator